MNLLEVEIKEVYSVTDITNQFIDKYYWNGEQMLEVVMLTDCWGCKEVLTRTFSASEWERIKCQGYFVE